MAMYDRLTTSIEKAVGIDQQAITTPVNGASISLAGVVSLCWVFFCNAYTSGTMTFSIETYDGSSWTALPAKYVINGDISITADNQVKSIGMSGLDLPANTHARLVTVGTVELSGCALALIEKVDRA